MWKMFEGPRGYVIHDDNGIVLQTACRGLDAKKVAMKVVDMMNGPEAAAVPDKAPAEAAPVEAPPPVPLDDLPEEKTPTGLFGKKTKKKTSKK